MQRVAFAQARTPNPGLIPRRQAEACKCVTLRAFEQRAFFTVQAGKPHVQSLRHPDESREVRARPIRRNLHSPVSDRKLLIWTKLPQLPTRSPWTARRRSTLRRRCSGDTLALGVVLLLASTVLQRAAGFAREICFCRWLSPEQLGQWDMAFGFLMLAGPLLVMSLPGTFGRYVDRYRQAGQLRSFLRRTAGFCAALTVPSVLAIAGLPRLVLLPGLRQPRARRPGRAHGLRAAVRSSPSISSSA